MKAYKYVTEVNARGQIRLPKLELKRGTKVEVIILEPEGDEADLLKAAETTLAFWYNALDDEVWNEP